MRLSFGALSFLRHTGTLILHFMYVQVVLLLFHIFLIGFGIDVEQPHDGTSGAAKYHMSAAFCRHAARL